MFRRHSPVRIHNERITPSVIPEKQKTGEKPSTNGHPAYQNPRTHWWDVSFVYGSDEETLRNTRTYEGGRIDAGRDGVMPHNPDGTIVTGDNKNSWVGVSLLQCLFAMEHNSIADEMAAAHPAWTGGFRVWSCFFSVGLGLDGWLGFSRRG